jgi:hypothetical protein
VSTPAAEVHPGILLVEIGGKLVNPHQVTWVEELHLRSGPQVVIHFAAGSAPSMVAPGVTLAQVRQILKEG